MAAPKYLHQIPAPALKPSLAEVAEMPFPASLVAMRKYYNSEWGKPIPEGVDKARKFRAVVSFSYREESSKSYDIEAFSQKEAEELAEKAFGEDRDLRWLDDCEIDEIEVEEVADA
ncbi:hypothetical protein [Sphingomonas sp.]|uniref:hypothetical protein n=1 Tax=Sphingomonas sp. TaxID=28214 RepID=UPI0031CFA2FC